MGCCISYRVSGGEPLLALGFGRLSCVSAKERKSRWHQNRSTRIVVVKRRRKGNRKQKRKTAFVLQWLSMYVSPHHREMKTSAHVRNQ